MCFKSTFRNGFLAFLFFFCSANLFGIKIGLLEINGNNTITREEILENVSVCREGSDVTLADIENDIFMIKDMGYFSKVTYSITDYIGDTKILTFQIEEYPLVNKIELIVQGPSLIKKVELEKLITLESSKALNFKKLIRTQNGIKNMFVANDYEMVEISNNLESNEFGYYIPEGILKINIKEFALYDFKLEGELGDLTYEEIKEILDLRLLKDYYAEFFKLFLIKKNYYPQTSTLQMALSKLYSTQLIGPDTKFDVSQSERVLDEGEFVVDLVLNIQLNPVVPQGRPINGISISGNTVVSSEKLISSLRSTNDINTVLINVLRDMQKIKKIYEEVGYPYVIVTPKYDSKTGILYFAVTEAQIKEVKIEGIQKTREDLIWKNVRLDYGVPIKYSDVKQTYINLNKTGFFDEINIEPVGFSQYSTSTTFIITLKESRENISIKSGATFDPRNTGDNILQKLYGTLNLGLVNPVGLGQNINLDATLGKYPKITLNYSIPSVFASPFDAGISFGYSQVQQYKELDFDESSTKVYFINEDFSISPNLAYHIDDFQTIQTSFTWGKFKRFDFGTEDQSLLDQIKKEGNIGVFGLSYTFDSRDDSVDPNEGIVFNLKGDYSLPFASEEWLNLYESLSAFYSPMTDHVIAGRIFMAQNPWDRDGTSIFSIKGPNNMFVRSLSFENPGDAGDYAFCVNAEYRIRAVKENNFSVTFLGFADLGYAFSDVSSMSWNNFNSTIGVGARLQIPGFGMFRLDLGLDVSPDVFEKYGSPQFGFSFGLGHRF